MKSPACFAEPTLPVLDTEAVYYPIALDFEYYVMERGCIVAAGTGKTIEISSKAIVFESASNFPTGTALHLIARWPVLYQGKDVLRWIVQGTVVCHTASSTALLIEHERLMRPARTSLEPRLSEIGV